MTVCAAFSFARVGPDEWFMWLTVGETYDRNIHRDGVGVTPG